MGKPTYQRRKAAGLCTVCGLVKAREGKTECGPCAAKKYQQRLKACRVCGEVKHCRDFPIRRTPGKRIKRSTECRECRNAKRAITRDGLDIAQAKDFDATAFLEATTEYVRARGGIPEREARMKASQIPDMGALLTLLIEIVDPMRSTVRGE